MGNMRRQTQRNYGWRGGKGCQENYKKMGGSPGGSRKKVKMDRSAIWVGTGKHESRENGMDAQIYSVILMKTSLIPPKSLDFTSGVNRSPALRKSLSGKHCLNFTANCVGIG